MSEQLSIGIRLREARQSRGLQLADIAGTLRIKPQYLEALEADRPDALPTPTHASGFLRSYARYLGVDPADIAAALPAAPVVPPLAPAAVQPQRFIAVLPPLLILVGLALLYALWQWLQAPPPTPVAPPPADFGATRLEPLEPTIAPKPEAKVEPAPAMAPPESAGSTPAEAPAMPTPVTPAKPVAKTDAAKPETVVVRAISDSWVQVTDAKGRQLYSRLMRAGESWRAPQLSGLRLSTGNAGGLVLVKNGEAGVPLGSQAQVLRNLQLTQPAPPAETAPASAEPASAATPAAASDQDTEE